MVGVWLLASLAFASAGTRRKHGRRTYGSRSAESDAARVVAHARNTQHAQQILARRNPADATEAAPGLPALHKVIVTLAFPESDESFEAQPFRRRTKVAVKKPELPKQRARKGRNPMRALGRALAGSALLGSVDVADAASTACAAKDGFHPLTYVLPGLVHQVDSNCAGVVRKNGQMLPEPLLPGLNFVPMKWFGTHITDVTTIPDEDMYDNIKAVTADHIQYDFDISVTNEVTPANIVAVVRRMGFNYDQQNLRLLVNNAVKEVIKGLPWMDVEVHKATELNELFMYKIRDELKAKYGDELGSKIHILATTIQKVDCKSPGLLKNLKEQAEYESKRQLEIKKREAELEQIKTQVQKEKAEHDAAEVGRQAEADRKMADAKAGAAEQEVQNTAIINKAKAEAEANRLIAEQKVQELEHTADVFERHPGYATHLNQLKVAESLLTPTTKLVITTSTFDSVGKLFTGVGGSTKGWFSDAWSKVTGQCKDDSAKTEQTSVPDWASTEK